jgi:ribosomal protein S18 acetylase RimI-like enzyme
LPVAEKTVCGKVGPTRRDSVRRFRMVALSERLWGLDWSRVLPWAFDGVAVEHATYEQALPFITEHYPSIFATRDYSARFVVEPMTPAKRRFGAEMDVFLVRADGHTGGVFMGHPSDWSTYYIRSTGLLPEFQRRGVGARLADRVCEQVAAAGASRVEVDVVPTNTPILRLLQGRGFLVTSTSTSERWGLVLRLTKFLEPIAESVFVRQFCPIVVSSSNNPTLTPTRTP